MREMKRGRGGEIEALRDVFWEVGEMKKKNWFMVVVGGCIHGPWVGLAMMGSGGLQVTCFVEGRYLPRLPLSIGLGGLASIQVDTEAIAKLRA